MSKVKGLMASAAGWTRRLRGTRGVVLAGVLTLLVAGSVMAAINADLTKNVGERAPLFSAVTSQDTLVDYNRDFYGRHHLVLTFFPAAFTPV